MSGRQAKTLTATDLKRVLALAGRGRHGARNRVMVLLSVKAGLRAGEIAALRWPMVCDARGRVGRVIELWDQSAKNRKGRIIPMHPAIRIGLTELGRGGRCGPVIRSVRGGALRADSIVNWFAALFRQAGLHGCSSHSGRRTFITKAARAVGRTGASLRDVQQLAGHESISMTQRYIDGDSQAQRRLVRRL